MGRRARLGVALALSAAAIAMAGGCAWVYASTPAYPTDSAQARRADAQDFTAVQRGRYLTAAADCEACHTAPGGQPFAGGRAIETPFGSILAANITPDPQTGIGAWSDAEFDAALRLGRGRDHGFLYPAMPYVYYTKLTKEDTAAIRAYLATVAPARNKVVSNRLPFPFNVRLGMAAWDALFFNPGVFVSDSHKSAQWNRGAYLVQGPGHCGACHTPKNPLGGDRVGQSLRGYTLQGWFAPNITDSACDGLSEWSVDDIKAYLKSGHNRVAGATGPMAEEIAFGSSRMSDADLAAIAAYLKSLDGNASGASGGAPPGGQMRAGEAIYRDVCSACHGIDEKGVAGLYPDLALAPSVRAADPQSLIRAVLRGARSVATDEVPTAAAMPAFGWQLSNVQVAAVLTYLRNHEGAKADPIAPSRVQSEREALARRND